MKSSNQTGCIIAVLIVVALCCCFALATLGGIGWLTSWRFDIDWGRPWEVFRDVDWDQPLAGGRFAEASEQTFEAGDAPAVDVDIFAGEVQIRAGEGDTVQVTVTKKANTRTNLDRIEVNLTQSDSKVRVEGRVPSLRTGNVSVEVVIVAPAGSRLDVNTGAGQIVIQDMTGEIIVDSGAGDINVTGAQGAVDLHVGAGAIHYEGSPSGRCRFDTGAGEITLRVPGDANLELDLGVGIGDVDVQGFDVAGQVSRSAVDGTIGDGSQGSIFAHSGAGSINLLSR